MGKVSQIALYVLYIPVEKFRDSNNALLIPVEFKMYWWKSFTMITEFLKLFCFTVLEILHRRKVWESGSICECFLTLIVPAEIFMSLPKSRKFSRKLWQK